MMEPWLFTPTVTLAWQFSGARAGAALVLASELDVSGGSTHWRFARVRTAYRPACYVAYHDGVIQH